MTMIERVSSFKNEYFNALIEKYTDRKQAPEKESIINAYEIKTGLSRARLAHLMDAETWLSAHKAVELKFADGLLFHGEGEADAPEPESFAFSRRAVTNSLLDKLAPKNREHRQQAGPLYERLNLLRL